MKVSDLVEMLQEMDQNAEVHFAYNYGDHWNTQVAPEVTEVLEAQIIHSDYHQMPKVIDQDDDCIDGARTVVVIS